ncbi:MAG: hypothetical protein JO112_00075 [Planctomycetes bacterium]|nr:hypothetical protein [Planctomycetota bacterium]
MISAEFRANRQNFPEAELEKYRGHWVAFRADGRSIIAHAATIEDLQQRLAEQSHKPDEVVVERVLDEDSCLGAEEL